jgi:hypothetical protein
MAHRKLKAFLMGKKPKTWCPSRWHFLQMTLILTIKYDV